MAKRLRIGDDRREAVDWFQDRSGTTRPQAERAVVDMLREGAAVTEASGIFLLEASDEEIERYRTRSSNSLSKNYARIRSRSTTHVRPGKRMGKLVKTDYSDVANNMIYKARKSDDKDAS